MSVLGYKGKILEIDLSKEEYKEVPLNKKWIELYIGGAGYAVRLLYDMIDRETSPFSPANPLIIMTGPFTGVASISPKTALVARSPLTGFIGKSIVGGSFGVALKKAGYDGIVIKGKAKRPVYLFVSDKVGFRDAAGIWGKGIFETTRSIREELNDSRVRIAAIGPAGEKLVRISAVITDERRAAGRTGLGAVMGSKLLKAIAVRGESRIKIADELKLRELNKKHLAVAPKTSRGGSLRAYGTAGGIIAGAQTGNLPVKNWTGGPWAEVERIAPQTFLEKYKLGAGLKTCGDEIFCSIQCERRIHMRDPKYGETVGKAPEYETLAALGSMTLVDNVEAIIKANDVCDDMGLDTISTGAAIAWAMEAYEKGFLTDSDLGFSLGWGEADAVISMINMIAKKEGFGTILSEGVRKAAEILDKGSEDFAIHVKGLELPMHNPRLYHTMGLIYAISNRGACHLQGMAMLVERGMLLPEYGLESAPKDNPSKVKTVQICQSLCEFMDSAGLCKFGTFGVIGFSHFPETLNAITGRNETKDSILQIGTRIWYLERLLNVRLGLKTEDDTLPKRFISEHLETGPLRDATCPIDVLKQEFYDAMKLDPVTGRPDPKELEELEVA